MELLALVITILCYTFCLLSTPTTSHQIHLHASPQHATGVQLSVSVMPRKMKLSEVNTVKAHEVNDHASYHQQAQDFPGNTKRGHNKEAEKVHKRGGATWREWTEEGLTDRSEFFTMDYSHVRRRRPIHNKFVPVGRP